MPNTKEEKEPWEPSNKIVDNDERSNTNNKSEKHDLDEISMYTTGKGEDEDEDYGEKYLHLGKQVDMKGVEESLLLGVRIRMMREKGELSQKKQVQLCHHVIKIKNLCLEVTKSYIKHYKKMNSCPPPKHCLNMIKLLFDQHIERRCAKYNLTKEEEEQLEPSNINSDDNKLSNTNDKSEEHDSDEFNLHTTSKGKDEDKDDHKEYKHIGEKVDREGA